MRVRRALARAYWRVSRFTHVSSVRPEGSGILVGAPHTSNWDFVLMLAIAWDLGLTVRYLGKDALFKPPFGFVMKALGGIPVDRKNPTGLVDTLVERARTEPFLLVVTPEGTRSAGTYWKSGFWRIAVGAGMPITLGYVDRATMTAGLGTTFEPTGDVRTDMDTVRAFYADKSGVRPEKRTEPRLREEDEA
jgi:1-acyl-sn-glycerol-3-phosphate acyltransferase